MREIEVVQLDKSEASIFVYLLHNPNSTITEIYEGIKDNPSPGDGIERENVKKCLFSLRRFTDVVKIHYDDKYQHIHYELAEESGVIALLIESNGYGWYSKQGYIINMGDRRFKSLLKEISRIKENHLKPDFPK